jgi:hypothetical protein
MALNEYDILHGTPVQVKGIGLGYVSKITRGARPYHVTMVDGGKVYVCSFRHLDNPLLAADVSAATEAYLASIRAQGEAYHELTLGTVCTLDSRPDYYVVIGTVKAGKIKVAKLGGDDNRYVTAPITMVTAVHASKVEVVRA